VSDRLEQLGTFCALTPVADEGALRDELASWESGESSPLAQVAGTHFSRFVVLPGVPREEARQPDDGLDQPYLMFSAFFDGEPTVWLDAFCERLADECERVWRHCRGYPGRATFRPWLVEHRVTATAVFGAYPEATVDDVRAALAFRRRFREFVVAFEARRDGREAFAAFARAEAER
jgi:hypothetical protein